MVRIRDDRVDVLLSDVVVNKSMGELTPICAYHKTQKHKQMFWNKMISLF